MKINKLVLLICFILVGFMSFTSAALCVGGAIDPNCWSPAVSDLAWGPTGATGLDELTSAADNGSANTIALAGLTGDYPAADYCAGLDYGDHTDWYLPAINQLTAGLTAYQSHFGSDPTWGGFADNTGYWSSTEDSVGPEGSAWIAYYYSGDDNVYSYNDNKDNTYYQTRCLRDPPVCPGGMLGEEEMLLLQLIKVVQRDCFENNRMSMEEYNEAMVQYENRLSEIIQTRINIETKIANLMRFSGKRNALMQEQARLLALVRQVQDDYLNREKIDSCL